MQAIVTKHIGPTNTRGDRIKATASSGSVTVPYGRATNTEGAHRAAALALCTKFGWDFDHVPGDLPDGSLAWVRLPKMGV